MNRDELRTRSQGEIPTPWQDPPILAPQDPDAGGTWIGVRRDGTWACLLNGYAAPSPEQDLTNPQTRGRIVPLVLGAPDALAALQNEDLASTRSFRAWIGNNTGISDVFWDGAELTIKEIEAAPWAFVTSSSLRQAEIKNTRRQAFVAWVEAGAQHSRNGLPLLHTAQGELPTEEAIFMQRDYAHTKSCTQIIIDGAMIQMQHWLEPDAERMPDACLELHP